MDENHIIVIVGFIILNASFGYMMWQGTDTHTYCYTHLPQSNQSGTPEEFHCVMQSVIIPIIGLFFGAFLVVFGPRRR